MLSLGTEGLFALLLNVTSSGCHLTRLGEGRLLEFEKRRFGPWVQLQVVQIGGWVGDWASPAQKVLVASGASVTLSGSFTAVASPNLPIPSAAKSQVSRSDWH
jgi:hypothetical protein